MKTVWPDNRPFALALSHDVDRTCKRWQYPFYFAGAIYRRQPDHLLRHLYSLKASLSGDDPYWNFTRIMDLEESLGVRSTFFFLNESSRWRLFNLESMMLFIGRYRIHDERIQDAIRVLDEKGWEIGMHGSYYSYQEKSLLEKEKQALEAILGKTVYGSRQHYLNLNIPETWQYQSQLGLAYDSTLGYTRRVGFKWNMTQPFYPRNPATGKAIPILQIPLGIMDVPLMKLPDPWEAALHLIDEANDKQAVLTLNWHQRVFNPWEFQAWQDIYIRIIQESLRREAWVVPLGRIANWWDGLQEGKAGIFE